VQYLQEAKAQADLLVVGLNSDGSVRALKGPHRPVNPLDARAMVLAGLQVVDFISVFDDETPLRLIRDVRPDVLVKGGRLPQGGRRWGGFRGVLRRPRSTWLLCATATPRRRYSTSSRPHDMRICRFLPNWIGDVVMATPAIRAVGRHFPKARIVAVGKPYVAAVVEGSPHLGEFIPLAKGREWSVAARLREERIDLALIFPNSFRTAFVAWLGALPPPRRIFALFPRLRC